MCALPFLTTCLLEKGWGQRGAEPQHFVKNLQRLHLLGVRGKALRQSLNILSAYHK